MRKEKERRSREKKCRYEILILEHELPHALILKAALVSTGLDRNSITIITNGQEALKYIERKAQHEDRGVPDLIFIELQLSGGENTLVIGKIRTNPELQNVPIVLLTDPHNPITDTIYLTLGIDQMLAKTSDYLKFKQDIGEVLHRFIPNVTKPLMSWQKLSGSFLTNLTKR